MGFSLALLTALLIATSDTLTRRLFILEPTRGAREVMVIRLLVAVPILLASVPLVEAPSQPATVWWVVAMGTPLEATALLLYIRAIRIGSLSVALPILAVSPALMLVTGPLIAGDRSSLQALPGILLITAGAYLLHLGEAKRKWAGPILALAREPAARLMLLVALIYSITGALGKKGVMASSPTTMAVYYFLALALIGTVAAGVPPGRLAAVARSRPILTTLIGLSFTAHLFTHMAAVKCMPVAEMIAVKRLSLLLGSVAGVFLLGEPAPRGRIAGAVLMVVGAAWIGFAR